MATHQQHSGLKEVSKRSGTTGGTESKNNLIKPFLGEMDTNLQALMNTSNNATSSMTKQGSKKNGRSLIQQSRNSNISKIEQLRASSQMKQYTTGSNNNMTLDFDALQARPGVHSTLGHFNH
jgi:hypothetical protein